jgi:hypothetical protein
MKPLSFFCRIALPLVFVVAIFTGAPHAALAFNPTVTAQPVIGRLVYMHQVDMRFAPQSKYIPMTREGEMPFLVGVSPSLWYLRKQAARHNPMAPYDAHAFPGNYDLSPNTPRASVMFDGMANSASICQYFGGCEPPDMAVAASSSFEVQAVNTSVAVYDPTGAIQPGWPKNSQVFFNVPNPGSCDPNGPFNSDPRAIYDPTDGHYWVTMLQVEGAFGINSCPLQSLYWVAVTQTTDPNGTWNVYAFDMTFGAHNAADYTQIGLDKRAFYFGGNMFNSGGSAYLYDEIFAASKAGMEAGSTVTAHGLKNIKVGSTLLDTVQPVVAEGRSAPAGLFVSAFNMNSDCSNACTGINVLAMAHALTSPTLTVQTATSMNYSVPPNADEPGCSQCVETLDTRISATPVYSKGNIWFALGTGANNGSGGTVPGVMWGEIAPTFSGTSLTAAAMVQNGVLSFTGDRDASFGAPMPDKAGNMIMVFDSMSSTLNPSIYFAGRKHTDALGMLQNPRLLRMGITATFDGRWGDYEASGYEGPTTNRIWMASEYSPSNGDWASELGATKF